MPPTQSAILLTRPTKITFAEMRAQG